MDDWRPRHGRQPPQDYQPGVTTGDNQRGIQVRLRHSITSLAVLDPTPLGWRRNMYFRQHLTIATLP